MDILCECGGGGGGLVEALNTQIYGNGTQTIVLSHGFGTDQNVWQYLFSVQKSIYMGHSMSAMIGCKAAIRRPELFEHLVLLSGSPRYLNEKGYSGGFRRSDLNNIFEYIHQNFTGWVRSFAPKAIGVNSRTAIAKFEFSLERMQPEVALSVAKTVFLSDLRRVLPKVQVPSTIIQSEKDIIVPKSVAFYMKRKLGGHARVNLLKTQGHFPQLTAFPLLSHVLKRLLSTTK